MKMYILVKDSVPDHFAPVVSAHASLACYKRFEDDPDMQYWITKSFKKVVCRVNAGEFERAKKEEKYVIMHESALGGVETGLAFCPREEYAKPFRFFQMWKPQKED